MCSSDLRYFPMDHQTCAIEIESCESDSLIGNVILFLTPMRDWNSLLFIVSSNMADIKYNWASGTESVGVSPDVALPQWKVLGHRQQAVEIALTTGNLA